MSTEQPEYSCTAFGPLLEFENGELLCKFAKNVTHILLAPPAPSKPTFKTNYYVTESFAGARSDLILYNTQTSGTSLFV